ncbi:hypothetical protein PR048_018531 [Dryococelus australis]|uniref:Uncharacterized protein n=1 Tax=Dryococelus australis TaxID=614101 RepID=A0ABQ9HCK3_9NEOP|nr:hypothetical protein PR048_018531 [Dryococelus australis]
MNSRAKRTDAGITHHRYPLFVSIPMIVDVAPSIRDSNRLHTRQHLRCPEAKYQKDCHGNRITNRLSKVQPSNVMASHAGIMPIHKLTPEPLVHAVFDISWRSLAQSSPSTATADNHCEFDIGIFLHKTAESCLQVIELANFPVPTLTLNNLTRTCGGDEPKPNQSPGNVSGGTPLTPPWSCGGTHTWSRDRSSGEGPRDGISYRPPCGLIGHYSPPGIFPCGCNGLNTGFRTTGSRPLIKMAEVDGWTYSSSSSEVFSFKCTDDKRHRPRATLPYVGRVVTVHWPVEGVSVVCDHISPKLFTGVETEYKSVDTVVRMDDAVRYPEEFITSSCPSVLSPQNLLCNFGTPLMLPPKGCNIAGLQWIARSPRTKAIRIRSPVGSLPDFRWTVPLAGGFSLGTPASPALAFQRRSNLGSHIMPCSGTTDTYGSQLEKPPLVHTVFGTSRGTPAQSSPSTVTADNQCTTDIGICLHTTIVSRLQTIDLTNFSGPNL